jgi:magnesium transporter
MRDSVGSEERLQHRLAEITRVLDRHRVLDVLASRQQGPRRDLLEQLQRRQNLAELHKHLRPMHAADIAYVIEALPPDDRRTICEETPDAQAPLVFVEVSEAVRAALARATPRGRMIALHCSKAPVRRGQPLGPL